MLTVLVMSCGMIMTVGYSGVNAQEKMPITTSSETAREYYLQGRELAEKLRGQESRQYFQNAVEEDPDFAVAHLQLAAVQPSVKAFFESFYKAKALLDKVSKAERLWILGVEAGGIAGNPMGQRELYKELVDAYPDDERAHNLLATNYFGQQEWEMAVLEYERAAEINPEFSPLYNQLGYALRFLERYDDAEKIFKKYTELIPDDPNPYDSYAELLLRTGRFSQSLAYYQKALRKNPYFFPAYGGVASVHNYLGEYDEARILLQTLFDRARNATHHRMAYFALAVSYADEGNLDSALAQMQKSYALAKQANDVLTMAEDLNTMGHILLELGKSNEALKRYKQAARLVEKSSLVQTIKDAAGHRYIYHAARVAVSQGKLTLAKKHAEEYRTMTATAKDPLHIKMSHELAGMIALAEKEHQTAVTELQMTDLCDPRNLHRLAQAYQGIGNEQKSVEMEQAAATFYKDNNLKHALIRAKAKESLAAAVPE